MRAIFLMSLLCLSCEAAFTDLRPPVAPEGDMQDLGVLDEGSPDVGFADDMEPAADAAADMPPAEDRVIAVGPFMARANYGGTGTASLVELADGSYEVRLSDDFSIGSVPGPTVILAREDSLGSTLDPARGDLELGVLESNSGASTYAVPGDPGDRRIVWIYCKPFGLQMASAQMVAP